MKKEEKEKVRRLRLAGQGYAQIAGTLGMPEGTIKTFCRRNGLLKVDIGFTSSKDIGLCKQCGKHLDNLPKRKPKQFCSDGCRLTWWNANRDQVNKISVHRLVCATCGKGFDAYGIGRRYCSHACYINDRFKKARA